MIRYLQNLAFATLFAVQSVFHGLVGNRYEAGQRWGTGRSWLDGWVQDADQDADAPTRQEIVRKARYLRTEQRDRQSAG
jgi:hypothetical protein